MWIKHPSTGVVVYTSHEAHIARLLAEGGTEMPDPRVVGATLVAKNEQATADFTSGTWTQELVPEQEEVHEVIDISKKRRRRASQ